MTQHIIIGITGSSGIIYGIRLLEILKQLEIITHLIITPTGLITLTYETDLCKSDLIALADVYHPYKDLTASIASGSFQTMGMIVAPCSMKSLSEIAHGIGSNLLTRAADVTLKERRRLVLLPREAPLHKGHINNMLQVTDMGGIIFPPVPAFYQRPQTVNDIINDTVGRVLDLFAIESGLVQRWK